MKLKSNWFENIKSLYKKFLKKYVAYLKAWHDLVRKYYFKINYSNSYRMLKCHFRLYAATIGFSYTYIYFYYYFL